MARTRLTDEERAEATQVTLIPATPDVDDGDLQDAYDQWREDLRGSETPATLRVYRVPTDINGHPQVNAKHQGNLFSCPLDAMGYEDVIEKLRREFILPGARSITARIMAIKAKGLNGDPARTLFNKIVTIERGAEMTTPKGNSDVAELVRLMQDNARQQMEMMQRLLENRPQSDPLELAMKMTQTMTGMVAAVTAGNSGGHSSLKEAIEIVTLLRGNSSPATSMKEMVESIVAVKGLLGGLNEDGGGEDGDTPAGIIKAVSPLAAPIFEALAAYNKNQAEARRLASEKIAARRLAAPRAGNVSPARPKVEAPVNTAEPVTPKPQEENVMLKVLREQLETLVQVASENGNPVALAEGLLEMVPEQYDEEVWKFVSAESCMSTLSALHPRVKEFLPWFEQFRAAIIAQYGEDENAASNSDFTPEHDLTPQAKAHLKDSGRLKS